MTASGKAPPHLLHRIGRMLFGFQDPRSAPHPIQHQAHPTYPFTPSDYLLSTINEGVFVARREPGTDDLRIISANPAFAELMGLDPVAIEGQLLRECLPQEQGDRLRTQGHQCLEQHHPVHYPEQISSQGQERHLRISLHPLPELQPPCQTIVGTCQDITELHRAQRALRHHTHTDQLLRETYQHLGDQLAMAIQYHELSQQIQQLKDHLDHQMRSCTVELQQSVGFAALLRRITDKIRNSLEERVVLEIAVQELTHVLDLVCCQMGYFHGSDPDSYTIQHAYGLLSGTPSQPFCLISHLETRTFVYRQLQAGETLQVCVQEGRQRSWALALICPISDAQGVIGALVLYRSLGLNWSQTEIRFAEQVASQCAVGIRQARLYQAAQEQVVELERLNRLKDDFLSMVSHELRTPLTNMKMSIQMLKLSQAQAPLSPKQQSYLEMLENECCREADLITDLLDLQQLEAQRYPYHPQQVDLRYWLFEVVRAFELRAQQRDLQLSLDLPEHLPSLWLDPSYLNRILRELLTNACKYTPPQGQIQVKAQLQTDPDGVEGLQICLSNTVEIPAQELPHLFECFYRVLQLDQWQQGGTGLGLSLVQKWVEGLSGRIEVISSEGWTHFQVWIPRSAQPRAAPVPERPTLPGQPIDPELHGESSGGSSSPVFRTSSSSPPP